MKRIAGMILLAGLGGGCASTTGAGKTADTVKPFNAAYTGVEVPGVSGAAGEPVHMTAARGVAPQGDAAVQQASGFSRILGGGKSAGCETGNCGGSAVHTPGMFAGHGHGGGYDPYAAGPMGSQLGTMLGHNGIMPVPGMGPAGAVAAVGAIGAGSPYGPTISNQRTSIKFVNPQGTKVTWLGPTGYLEPGLSTPATYNFLQGNVYRLKLSGVPNRPGKVYYPTLEVAGTTAKTVTYLSHATVPVAFTDDDFERVAAGNLVVKVIYLPDAQFQDLAAVAGAEEVVSTQLQPGEDPVVEATRRGTVLAIIRLGNIDLENPNSPAMDAPMGGMTRPAPAPAAMPTTAAAPMAPAGLPTVKATPTGLKK